MTLAKLIVGLGADTAQLKSDLAEAVTTINQMAMQMKAAGKVGADDYGRSLDNAGRSTNNLTQFIREQRKENRIQNFFFRETKDTIGTLTFGILALTNITGDHSESMKKLNTVLVSGFSAFQAVDFASKALGVTSGFVTTGLGAIVAISMMLIPLLGTAAEKEKQLTEQHKKEAEALRDVTERYDDWMKRLEKGRPEEKKAVSKEELTLLRARMEILSKIITGEKDQIIVLDDQKRTAAEVEAMQQEALVSQGKTAEELKQRYVELNHQIVAVGAAYRETDVMPKGWEKSIKAQEEKVASLKSERDTLSDMTEIRLKNQEIEHEELRLGMLQRGTSLERELDLNKELQSWLAMQNDVADVNRVVEELDKNISKLHVRKPIPVEIDTERISFDLRIILDSIHKVNDEEDRLIDGIERGLDRLSSSLQAIGVSMKSFMAKLIEGIKYLIEMSKMIKSNQGEGGGSDILSIIGDIIGIVSLFSAAEGGIAYEPRLAIVGDNPDARSNPEVIAPLSKITGIMRDILFPNFRVSAVENRKDLFFSGLPKLANGGVISGPTLAFVGDNPNAGVNPEVIAPLSELRPLLGGQRIELSGKLTAEGSDLVYVFNRTLDDRGRTT